MTDGAISCTSLSARQAYTDGNAWRRLADDLFNRASSSEDYTSDGKVELYGKACDDVKSATADVEITVGCETIVK